jgi:hypothetical protein
MALAAARKSCPVLVGRDDMNVVDVEEQAAARLLRDVESP